MLLASSVFCWTRLHHSPAAFHVHLCFSYFRLYVYFASVLPLKVVHLSALSMALAIWCCLGKRTVPQYLQLAYCCLYKVFACLSLWFSFLGFYFTLFLIALNSLLSSNTFWHCCFDLSDSILLAFLVLLYC